MADGFLLDVDTSKLREADNYFKSMISNAEKLQTALKGALGDPKAFAAVNVLERVKSFMTEIGDTRLSPRVDTKRLEDFSSELANIVEMMQLMSRQRGFEFFDTKSVRDMEGNAFRIQKLINGIDVEIKEKQKEYNNILFKAPIDPATGKKLPKNRKVYKAAVLAYEEEQDVVWREIKALEEKKKGYQADLRLAKMTEDEKLQYVMKNIAKESEEKQKEINSQRARYKTLLSEQLDIQKKIEQAGKYGDLGEEGQKAIDEYNRQFEIRDKERRKIEEDYAVFVVDLTENAQRKMLDANLKRIKQEQEAQQLAYRTSAQGALEYAGKASTINEMKDAQKYLQIARGNVNVADTDTIKKLNDEYTRLRATIEALTTAEKNEQSLQPSLRNEYIRLRKELDANREAQEKFANLKDGNTEDQAALVDREQDLQKQILSIKQNAGALLDETDRKYEAEKSRRAIELAEKTEAQKAEIAKRKAREAYEEYKKTGVLSVDKAERLIGLTDNAKNAAQAEKAIKSLENAKKRLDNTDSRYRTTVQNINQAISKHKKTLEQTKPVVEATVRLSAEDALNNAKNARTLQDLRQALKDLKQAREELDIENDADKIKDVGNAINDVNDKIKELEGKQKEVKQNNNDLSASFAGLKRLAIAWLGIEALKNYARKVVETRREFELLQKSLQNLLQDKDEANKLWNQTLQLALVSPFSVKDLISYTKQLAAYRIETELLHDRTKRLADVSAGLGVDMQRLILAYGQVRAASFLRATELRQFTEAGIPMLDELSKKLSEVEGRFISVGDVMEMISKRKISFEDVDETFVSMTSQGGVFYQMQEKQAETLHGMISNMKDAFDLMFNEIGKGNDGYIKGFIKGITNMAKEWRSWADEMTSIAIAVIAGKVGTSIASLGIGIGRTITRAKRLKNAFRALSATGWGVLIASLASVASYIYMINKRTDETLRKFQEVDNELTKDLNDSIRNFETLANKLKDVTTSYTEQQDALKELNRLYGDILPDQMLEVEAIKSMADGYEEATEALKTYYNAKAREQKTATVESEFFEKFSKTIDDIYDNLADVSIRQRTDGVMLETKGFFEHFGADEKYARSIIGDVVQDMKDGIVKIDDFYKEVVNRIEKFYKVDANLVADALNDKFIYGAKDLTDAITIAKDIVEDYNKGIANVSGLPYEDLDQAKQAEQAQKLREEYDAQAKKAEVLSLALSRLYEAYKKGEDEDAIQKLHKQVIGIYKELGQEPPKNFFDTVLSSALDVSDEVQRVKLSIIDAFKYKKLDEFYAFEEEEDGNLNATQNIGKELPVLIDKFFKELDKKAGEISGGELRNTIESIMREIADGVDLSIFDKLLIDDKTSLEDYRKLIGEEIDTMQDDIEKYTNAVNEAKEKGTPLDLIDAAHGKERLKEYEKAIPILTTLYNLLGGADKKGGGETSLVDERIKVIDDMVKKYDDFVKKFGHDEALKEAFNSYIDAFSTAYKDIEWIPKNVGQMTPEEFVEEVMDFADKDDVVKFLQKLANETTKEAERIKVLLAKGEYVYEMQVKAKTESDEDLNKRIEEMFSDYELSLELEKLNIPPDIAKSLFNVDTMSLKELRSQVESLRPKFIGTDQETEYKEYLKKISEMEEKEQMERLKKYSQYLVKGMSERVKLKREEAKQLAEIENLNYSDEQKKTIMDSVREDTQKKMDKLDWEDFKNSEMYIRIFQDLEKVSTKTLLSMRNKLSHLKTQLNDLDPTETKAIVESLEKLDSAISKRNPYKTAFLGIGKYFEALKNIKKLEKDLLEGQEKEIGIQDNLKVFSSILGDEEKKLKTLEKSENTSETDLQLQRELVEWYRLQVEELEKQLKIQQKRNGETSKGLSDAEKYRATFTGEWSDIGSDISNAASALPQMAAEVEKLFGTMDARTKDTIESISEIGSGVGSAIQGFASENYIQAASGILQAIGGAFAIGDKKKERAIQREIEKVKDLQRAYEKLEEAISYSYNIDDINRNYEAARKNIEDQIEATEKMRSLEESKKKTDKAKIKEYTQQIEDYQKQLQELEDERINQLGGIAGGEAIKSATENFVNAWIDAFRETGDGLSGLEEQFDEVFMNLVKKQVLGRGVDKLLKPLWDSFDVMLNDGGMDDQDFADFNKQWNSLSPQIDEFLTKMVNDLGIADDITKKTGGLSGLQEGIQGITEDQADILAAYWSSVRFIVSNIEQKFTEYARQMLGNDANTNPILAELKAQTTLLEEIDKKLGSVIGFSGGAHIKTNLIS